MDAEYSRGQRLFVETNSGNLEGVFYYMDAGHNRLTLTQVVLHQSGKKQEGFRHYYRNEVINGKFIYVCEVCDFPMAVMLWILRHLQYTVKPF
jgi:hypothetical protein